MGECAPSKQKTTANQCCTQPTTSAYPYEHKRTTDGPALQLHHNGRAQPQQDEPLPLAGAAALLEPPTVVQASTFNLLAVTELRMLWSASSSTRASLLQFATDDLKQKHEAKQLQLERLLLKSVLPPSIALRETQNITKRMCADTDDKLGALENTPWCLIKLAHALCILLGIEPELVQRRLSRRSSCSSWDDQFRPNLHKGSMQWEEDWFGALRLYMVIEGTQAEKRQHFEKIISDLDQLGNLWQLTTADIFTVRKLLDGLRPESTEMFSEVLRLMHDWALMLVRRWHSLAPAVLVNQCFAALDRTNRRMEMLDGMRLVAL